jgi:cyanophycinase
MTVLRRFVELCGTHLPEIAVLTGASAFPEDTWRSYQRAFLSLGAGRCVHVDLRSKAQADDARAVESILQADGVFMTGGDQRRLLSVVGDTATEGALQDAYRERGACIGGTSAGAAALSRHMLAEGRHPLRPQKHAARLDTGLGLLPGAIIDQHFWQRRRFGRLLSALAEEPEQLGVGVDEDTALIIDPGRSIEVVGRGMVTVLDGRRMNTNVQEVATRERMEMLGVRLHMLPAGNLYAVCETGCQMQASLASAIELLVAEKLLEGSA